MPTHWREAQTPLAATQSPAVASDRGLVSVPGTVKSLDFDLVSGLLDSGMQTVPGWGSVTTKLLRFYIEGILREYLCACWVGGGEGVEPMVVMTTVPPQGGALAYRTLALAKDVDFSHTAVTEELTKTRPTGVIWLRCRKGLVAHPNHPSGATGPGFFVSGLFVLPNLVGSVNIEAGLLGHLRPDVRLLARVTLNPWDFVQFSPFANVEEMEDKATKVLYSDEDFRELALGTGFPLEASDGQPGSTTVDGP